MVETQTDEAVREALRQFAVSLKHIAIEWRPDGILGSTYLQTTLAAVDEWMNFQRFLNSHFPPRTTLRQLLDSRRGLVPVVYSVQASNKMLAEFPTGPTHWVATITAKQDGTLTQMGMSLMNRLRSRVKLRSFSAERYDEAVAWLLSIKDAD